MTLDHRHSSSPPLRPSAVATPCASTTGGSPVPQHLSRPLNTTLPDLAHQETGLRGYGVDLWRFRMIICLSSIQDLWSTLYSYKTHLYTEMSQIQVPNIK